MFLSTSVLCFQFPSFDAALKLFVESDTLYADNHRKLLISIIDLVLVVRNTRFGGCWSCHNVCIYSGMIKLLFPIALVYILVASETFLCFPEIGKVIALNF